MNCRDITEILDNRKGATLPVAERRAAEAHVASCADCAGEWSIEGCLATLPDITVPQDFRSRCRAVVASRSSRVLPAGSRRRVIMVAMAALAAAAAVMVLLPRTPDSLLSHADARRTELRPANGDTGKTAAGESVAELPLQAGSPEPLVPLGFTVRLVMPDVGVNSGNDDAEAELSRMFGPAMAEEIDNYRKDPERKRALSSLYLALTTELRVIPGLSLVEADLPATEPPFRHYEVNVRILTSLTPDDKFQRPDDRYIPIVMSAGLKRRNAKPVMRLSTGVAIDLQAQCSRRQGGDPPCTDVQGAASELVRLLREKVFPPDPSVATALQSKLRDAKSEASERLKALTDLFRMQNDFQDARLLGDPQMVRAVLDLAASADPKTRAQIWRMMKGSGNTELIQPLMNSLLQDPDDVRLAAIGALAADFRNDPRVKALLYSVATEDRQPLVRALAERGLSGEAWWNDYVAASLRDSKKSPAQRIEAFVYELYPIAPLPQNENYFDRIKEILDGPTLRGLTEALPHAGTLQGDKGLAGSLLSNIGYQYNKDPAVTAMLLDVLEHDTMTRNRTIAGEVLARTHPGDPKVREALNRAMTTDPDLRVRDWVKQVLGVKTP